MLYHITLVRVYFIMAHFRYLKNLQRTPENTFKQIFARHKAVEGGKSPFVIITGLHFAAQYTYKKREEHVER